MDKKLKVFQIVTSERDLIAHYTNIGALKLYASVCVIDLSDFSESDEVVEIPESEWDKMHILMGDLLDENAPATTLREYVQKMDGPDYISSTCY